MLYLHAVSIIIFFFDPFKFTRTELSCLFLEYTGSFSSSELVSSLIHPALRLCAFLSDLFGFLLDFQLLFQFEQRWGFLVDLHTLAG